MELSLNTRDISRVPELGRAAMGFMFSKEATWQAVKEVLMRALFTEGLNGRFRDGRRTLKPQELTFIRRFYEPFLRDCLPDDLQFGHVKWMPRNLAPEEMKGFQGRLSIVVPVVVPESFIVQTTLRVTRELEKRWEVVTRDTLNKPDPRVRTTVISGWEPNFDTGLQRSWVAACSTTFYRVSMSNYRSMRSWVHNSDPSVIFEYEKQKTGPEDLQKVKYAEANLSEELMGHEEDHYLVAANRRDKTHYNAKMEQMLNARTLIDGRALGACAGQEGDKHFVLPTYVGNSFYAPPNYRVAGGQPMAQQPPDRILEMEQLQSEILAVMQLPRSLVMAATSRTSSGSDSSADDNDMITLLNAIAQWRTILLNQMQEIYTALTGRDDLEFSLEIRPPGRIQTYLTLMDQDVMADEGGKKRLAKMFLIPDNEILPEGESNKRKRQIPGASHQAAASTMAIKEDSMGADIGLVEATTRTKDAEGEERRAKARMIERQPKMEMKLELEKLQLERERMRLEASLKRKELAIKASQPASSGS